MKDILESMRGIQSLTDSILESKDEQIDEGLREILATLKKKFTQVWNYLTGVVVKLTGSYWCPVTDDGQVLNAISPLTAGQAYKDGAINPVSTLVCLGKKGKKIIGLNTTPKDAAKLYGSGDSRAYWKRALTESLELGGKTINEVKLHTEDPEAVYNVVDTPALKKRIAMAFKNKKLSRLLIWGAPGIGKTAILMSVLDELPNSSEYQLVVKTLSNETPDNFTLPKYVEVNGQEKAADIPKTWLPVYKPTGDAAQDQILDDACGKGLLFIDELSRATPQVLNVILPLINEGMFNGYKLGSGWVIIVASNRAEDELSGQADIGNALANRFAQLYYEPTVKSWKTWAEKQNFISPLLLSWLEMPAHENMSGGKFFYMDPNEDMEGAGVTKLMCTPRSWTNAMRELACYADTGSLEGFTIFDIDPDIIKLALNSHVPRQAVDGFMAFLHVISKVGNFDQVVHDIWQKGGSGVKIEKKDLRLVALPLAQLIITSHAGSYPTEKEMVNLANWLVATGNDQITSYILDILQHVFAGDLPERLRAGIFVMAKKSKTFTPDQQAMYDGAYKVLLDKWGFKSLKELPDWFPAHQIIAKKFGATFSQALIDGAEGLG